MLTHNIKLLSLCDLKLWQKNINVSMIKVFRLNLKSSFSIAFLSLQIAQSMAPITFKGCYLNYKLYDPLSHKYINSPNVW